MEKIIFSADLHGNINQYKSILEHAKTNKIDIVIFGGDLTPKDNTRRTPKGQRDFLINELFPLLESYNKTSNAHVLMIMRNDDFRSNHDLFVEGQDLYGYRVIDETPYISKSGYIFVGYSYVPFTPFKYKCWEKRDRKSDMNFTHRDDTQTKGVISKGDSLVPYNLSSAFKMTSIEGDLERLTEGLDKEKLILVTHAPPFNSNCDFNRQNKHVGSQGLRDFIQSASPLATLHGHIHETVDLTGSFSDTIGRTICFSVGNDHKPKRPFVLEGILSTPLALKRHQLD